MPVPLKVQSVVQIVAMQIPQLCHVPTEHKSQEVDAMIDKAIDICDRIFNKLGYDETTSKGSPRNLQLLSLDTREWLTGLMLQELVNAFNFNAGIEEKLEEKIGSLITDAIQIADKACTALATKPPIYSKFPSSQKLQWATPSHLKGSQEWIAVEESYPVPYCIVLALDFDGEVHPSYFESKTMSWRSMKVPLEEHLPVIRNVTHWLPIFFFPVTDDTNQA